MMKKLLFILLAVIAGIASVLFFMYRHYMIPVQTPGISAAEFQQIITAESMPYPEYVEIPSGFHHRHDRSAYPLAGAALIDIDNDGIDEIFITGGKGQNDRLLKITGTKVANIIEGTNINSDPIASYGAIALDANNDGYMDLVVLRENAVIRYINLGNGTFHINPLAGYLGMNNAPLSISHGDINNDGYPDLFISAFPVKYMANLQQALSRESSDNVLLIDDTRMNYRNIIKSSGIGRHIVLGSAMADLDGDGWQDIILATFGEIAIYRNQGDMTFQRVELDESLRDFGVWTSVTLLDADGDGRMDIFFTNIGDSLPDAALAEYIPAETQLRRSWMLLRNEGGMRFSDMTEQAGMGESAFAMAAGMADLNLNGRNELFVLENYADWIPHRFFPQQGRVMVRHTADKFVQAAEHLELRNFHAGVQVLFSDFNQDGYPDPVYVNVNGPLRIFLSRSSVRE